MNIDVNRKIIEDICKLDECGFVDPEAFNAGYSLETIGVYAILAAHNGKLKADELIKIYGYKGDVSGQIEEECKNALWLLYKGGFVELNTLTDEGVKIISEQLGLDKFE